MSKVHLISEDLGPYGPFLTYCGRSGSNLELTFDVRGVTCSNCRRAMVRDWCATCGRLLVAWEAEGVCACDARDGE
jgi:hypothetical protein